MGIGRNDFGMMEKDMFAGMGDTVKAAVAT